jgi:rhodanese-related sulfurtransferase
MRGAYMKILTTVFIMLCVFLIFFQASETRSGKHGGGTAIVEVSIDEAKTLFEEGAIFIDARSEEEYQKGHIEGAMLILKEELDEDILNIIFNNMSLWEGCSCDGTLRRKDVAEIVCTVYGSESDVEIKSKTAKRLMEEGFENVYIMQQGFNAWLRAGYPTEAEYTL